MPLLGIVVFFQLNNHFTSVGKFQFSKLSTCRNRLRRNIRRMISGRNHSPVPFIRSLDVEQSYLRTRKRVIIRPACRFIRRTQVTHHFHRAVHKGQSRIVRRHFGTPHLHQIALLKERRRSLIGFHNHFFLPYPIIIRIPRRYGQARSAIPMERVIRNEIAFGIHLVHLHRTVCLHRHSWIERPAPILVLRGSLKRTYRGSKGHSLSRGILSVIVLTGRKQQCKSRYIQHFQFSTFHGFH